VPHVAAPTGGRKQWPGSPAEAERHVSATLYQRCRDTPPIAAQTGVPLNQSSLGSRAGAAGERGVGAGGRAARWHDTGWAHAASGKGRLNFLYSSGINRAFGRQSLAAAASSRNLLREPGNAL